MAFNRNFRCFLLISCVLGALGICISPSFGAQQDEDQMAAAAQAYDNGRYADAFTNWQDAADQGNTDAMIAIANMYGQGEGRTKDLGKAAFWYQKAAVLGNTVGQLNYAQILENGFGVQKSQSDAYIWYRRASLAGSQWAQGRGQALAAKLTPSEKRRAELVIMQEKARTK